MYSVAAILWVCATERPIEQEHWQGIWSLVVTDSVVQEATGVPHEPARLVTCSSCA